VTAAVHFRPVDRAGGAAHFFGEPAEVLHGEVHFALRFREPPAGFQGQGVCQFVPPFGEDACGVAEQVRTVAHQGSGPCGEGVGRGVGGADGVFRGPLDETFSDHQPKTAEKAAQVLAGEGQECNLGARSLRTPDPADSSKGRLLRKVCFFSPFEKMSLRKPLISPATHVVPDHFPRCTLRAGRMFRP
jgi:hypothetical protein